jgi:hypothetical protein
LITGKETGMKEVGTGNTGRAWVLAKIAKGKKMGAAVTAIAKLNREKKPKKNEPPEARGWYIVRADELEGGGLMIVVDAETPNLRDEAVGKLKEKVPQLDKNSFTEYRVTGHHPEGPHQGVWDEIEKPNNPGSGSDGGSNLSDPKKLANPRPNPANPWG